MALRVVSLFSGIGAFEQALTNLNIPYEIAFFSEIDKDASKTYCNFHGINPNKNLGDIQKVSVPPNIGPIDLLTHGSPCQSFSSSGLQLGGDRDSGTQSSLMWYSVQLIEQIRPKFVIWENVKNVLTAKHKHNFDLYIEALNQLGYHSTYSIYNALDVGIPQKRERIFIVSQYGEPINPLEPLNAHLKPLTQFLDVPISEKLYLKEDKVNQYLSDSGFLELPKVTNNETLTGALRGRKNEQGIYLQRLELLNKPYINTLTRVTKDNILIDTHGIRYLSSDEYLRLMGYSQENVDLLNTLGISTSKRYLIIANSIVVPIVEHIYKQIFPAISKT